MEMPTSSELYSDFTVDSVNGKKIALTAIIKRINVSVSMMGQDIKLDSDDSSTLSNPQLGEAVKDVNNPKSVMIEVGKAHEDVNIEGLGNEENIALSLFLPFDAKAKVGTSISDSTIKEDGSKSVNVYTVTQSSKDEITVTATSDSKITGTKEQMGMEVKQNMQISASAIRVYNAVSGILKSETKTTTGSGTNEIQGMSIPVTMKGTSTMTVK
jgi:hypothetical protein